MLLLAALAHAQDEAAPPVSVARDAGDIGFGVTVGGGSLPGANAVIYAAPFLAFDVGLGPRWGMGADLYPSWMAMVGASAELGERRYHHGFFLRGGVTLPGATYTEAFVAVGYSARLYSRSGRHLFALDAGPGVFPVRDVPLSVHEQPTGLLYVRFGWTAFLHDPT